MAATLPYPAIQPFYNNSSQKATSGSVFHSINPATAQPLAVVHTASHADVDAAVAAGSAAFPSWARTSPAERARILLRAVALLRSRNDELAKVETHDTGKAFAETSTVDVVTGADVLEYYANLVGGGGLNGEQTQLREEAWFYSKKEPLGVCVGIGAWNYPIQIALWKSAPCLAAGNTMVYKPSEVTPIHATMLAEIYKEAGLPDGVFNVVHGDGKAVGEYLVGHPNVAKVSFTGQVSTGSAVAGAAARDMKGVTMELGGKSPLIVLPDADIESAVNGAMIANFFSTGQVCTNGTRVFIPENKKDEFQNLLLDKMQHVRMGEPMDEATNYGPLVSEAHLKKVQGYIEHGKNVDKATLIYDGMTANQNPSKIFKGSQLEKGYWCAPIIFTDCREDMKIVQDEIFGPVMSILTYPTSQASQSDSTYPSWLSPLIQRANSTPMGLAAGVFTRDVSLAHRVVDQLEAGICWINTWGESPAEMSVGGWKKSGVGVENGRKGLEAYLRNKSTLVEMSGPLPAAFSKL